jgi:hypothetical protein
MDASDREQRAAEMIAKFATEYHDFSDGYERSFERAAEKLWEEDAAEIEKAEIVHDFNFSEFNVKIDDYPTALNVVTCTESEVAQFNLYNAPDIQLGPRYTPSQLADIRRRLTKLRALANRLKNLKKQDSKAKDARRTANKRARKARKN